LASALKTQSALCVQATTKGASTNAKPRACEHHAAKCANRKGPHPATSPRCPERRSSRQTRQQKVTEMRSSPPAIEAITEQGHPSIQEDQVEMEITPADPDQASTSQVIPISSDTNTPEPLLQSHSSSRPTRELRLRTKLIARITQNLSFDDSNHMSVDDDSDST
jgi:hypothetical protein